MKNLRAVFDELYEAYESESVRDNSYLAKPIGQIKSHYFGFDHNGSPCLLIKTVDSKVKPPIRLESIEVLFASKCDVAFDGTSDLITLTSVVCKNTDRSVHLYFIHICEVLLDIIGESPGIDGVYAAVNQLVSLFKKISSPSGKSITGLIGELFYISKTSSVIDAVRIWRSNDDDRYDFSNDDYRIEVKSSKGRRREHSFSLEQCDPPAGTVGLLASLFIESSGGGKSLSNLINEIESELRGDSKLVLKLQEVIAETLGSSLPQALSTRFDVKLASSSLTFYYLESIPCPNHIPVEVSQVRFKSDLSGCQEIDLSDLCRRLPSLVPIVPKVK